MSQLVVAILWQLGMNLHTATCSLAAAAPQHTTALPLARSPPATPSLTHTSFKAQRPRGTAVRAAAGVAQSKASHRTTTAGPGLRTLVHLLSLVRFRTIRTASKLRTACLVSGLHPASHTSRSAGSSASQPSSSSGCA